MLSTIFKTLQIHRKNISCTVYIEKKMYLCSIENFNFCQLMLLCVYCVFVCLNYTGVMTFEFLQTVNGIRFRFNTYIY